MFKFSSDEVAEAAQSLVSAFSTDQSLRTGGNGKEISNSVFFSLRVWVAEAIRIMAKQVDGAAALEKLGVNPQRAIDILTKSIHYGEVASEMASSLVSLALFLEEGCDGVQKDFGRAVELYTRAIMRETALTPCGVSQTCCIEEKVLRKTLGVHYSFTIGRWIAAMSKQCSSLGTCLLKEAMGSRRTLREQPNCTVVQLMKMVMWGL